VAIAQKVRHALRAMEPQGYSSRARIRRTHGVLARAKYVISRPIPPRRWALRVTDDVANKRIVDFMLNKSKGRRRREAHPSRAFSFPISGYDDHSGEGDMSYGNWTNGGVCPRTRG